MTGEIQKETISVRDAKRFLKDVRRALKDGDIAPEARQRIESLTGEFESAIEQGNSSLIYKRYLALKVLVNEHVEVDAPNSFREYAESIGLAVVIALLIRAFFFEAFQIPTGSMIPTLEIGDHLFVNKFIYGIRIPFTDKYLAHFASPKRGEVVVFTFPNDEAKAYLAKQPHSQSACIDKDTLDGSKDFIKRIVAVEGDTVELRNNHLYINGSPLKYKKLPQTKVSDESGFLYPIDQEREYDNGQVYTIQYAGRDPNFGPVKVPDGHVFVMGDNRDKSADSRCWGSVPIDNIKGRAMFIWMHLTNNSFNFHRFGHSIHQSAE